MCRSRVRTPSLAPFLNTLLTMEIFDVVNQRDEVIGQATREECHSNPNLMHRTVHFTVVDKDNDSVLLTQRSFQKKHDAGKFCFLGEHVLSGESYEEAIVRGLKEELNISVKEFKEIGSKTFEYDTQKELVKFFIAYYDGGEIKYDSQELEGFYWIPISEIKECQKDISSMTKFWIDLIDWSKV